MKRLNLQIYWIWKACRDAQCRSLRRSLQIKPLWIFTHEQTHVCRAHRAVHSVSEGAGCNVLCSVNAELRRITCSVPDSNVLWQAAQRRRFCLQSAAQQTHACLPEVGVTSSWTHYEDQASMLSKCHSVAGEFIKISLSRQMPQKSIFQTGVKRYVHAILHFLTSSEWRMGALCKYQNI